MRNSIYFSFCSSIKKVADTLERVAVTSFALNFERKQTHMVEGRLKFIERVNVKSLATNFKHVMT